MTHSEIIILRLLASKDRYGYELDRLIEENRMRSWADIGFSSIYHVLNKLEGKSLLSSYSVKEPGSPKRKMYSISEQGKTTLREEVLRMLETPADFHDDFTVGLVSSDILGEGEFFHYLRGYRSHLEEKKRFYRQEIPQESRRKRRVAMAIDRFTKLIEAEIEWIDRQLARQGEETSG